MTRWCFALWSFFFVVWYVNWIDQHPNAYHGKECLLVLDGHTSRENPIALQLFRTWGIRVLVLPSHTTHVLQLFDVGLAGVLKTKFTNIFMEFLRNGKYYVPNNNRATMRKVAVEAFVEAWDLVCTKSNCSNTATSVGLEPVDKAAPKNSQYVRNLTEAEKSLYEARVRRNASLLNINNCEITKPEKNCRD